jgi:hypothetical protein
VDAPVEDPSRMGMCVSWKQNLARSGTDAGRAAERAAR